MRKLILNVSVIAQIAAALALFYLALCIPAHWMSMDKQVLTVAATDAPSRQEFAKILIDWGKTGTARFVLPDESPHDDALWAIEALEHTYPHYLISGGADPYFEAFLTGLDAQGINLRNRETLMAQLAVREAREHLFNYLNASSKAAVKDVLACRDLTGVTIFMPVNTAAGAPMDSAVLTTALLMQAGYVGDSLAQELRTWSQQAMRGNATSIGLLERWYMTVLSLGYRMNWVQLASLVEVMSEPQALHELAQACRLDPESLPVLYSSAMMHGGLDAVMLYYKHYDPEESLAALSWANEQGVGAVNMLVEEGLPLYQPRHWLDYFTTSPLPSLVELVYQDHRYGMAARILGLLLGSYLLIKVLVHLTFWRKRATVSSRDALPALRNLLLACLMTTLLLALLESGHPVQRSFSDSTQQAGLRLIGFVQNAQTIDNTLMNAITTDTFTIVILLLFFVLQLIIYFLGLTRISQIRNTPGDSHLRRLLLENEENFFDTGLYVGLGGTVASLILLSMNIVSASLVAAYASTLFGILFVAILKIFHVRPYRRSLIMEESANKKISDL